MERFNRRYFRIGLILILFFFATGLFYQSNSSLGFAQSNLSNLNVTDAEIQLNGSRIISIDAVTTSRVLSVAATIENDTSLDANGFNIELTFRREDSLIPIEGAVSCSVFNGTAGCTGKSLAAGTSASLIGTLVLTNEFIEAGRYILEVRVNPLGIVQTTTSDDAVETFLLVGIENPEYHPVTLSFSPSSPVNVGTSVNITTVIENTGLPSAPQLDVQFDYCVLVDITCAEAEFQSTGFASGVNGLITLSPTETVALNNAESITLSNRLDTTGFSTGRYIFRVTVTPVGETELDPNNNQISTFLTIGGVGAIGALCQIEGQITTLGEGIGDVPVDTGGTEPVSVLYVVAEESDGDVRLHAINKDELANAISTAPCPSIEGSGVTLDGNVSSFTIDDLTELLYVGLDNGRLEVVDINRADLLVRSSVQVGGGGLNALGARVSSSISGQVYVGSNTNSLNRVTVTRQNDNSLVVAQAQTCLSRSSPVDNVQIFQGKTYFTSGSSVFRIDETSCTSSSLETVFTVPGSASVTDLMIGRARFSRITVARIIVGDSDGNVHVLSVQGVALEGSPVNLGSPITGLALNDNSVVASAQRESVFVATENGQIDNIKFRVNVSRCTEGPFQLVSGARFNVIEPYQPTLGAFFDGSPINGWALAGSADNTLVIVNDECQTIQDPIQTSGPIEANILVQESQGGLGPSGISATYGGGSGLFETTIVF